MKLDACYIAAFGKLHEKEFSFRDGLNVLCEENGAGKTTLAAFLKCMLYGLSDNKKHSVTENERKRFTPYGGGVFGGSLTFSAEGRRFRIERTFGRCPVEDTFALYDAQTGKPSSYYKDPVGYSLFGLDADGFERVFYLSERELTGKNEAIGALLTESEQVGLSEGLSAALSRLDEARRRLDRRGGGGQIGEGEDTVARLSSEISALRAKSNSLIETEEALAALEAQLAGDTEHTAELARANTERLKRTRADLEAERARLQDFFRAGIPTAEDISVAELSLKTPKSTVSPEKGFRKKLRVSLLLLLLALGALGVAVGLSVSPIGYLLLLPAILYVMLLLKKKRNNSLHSSADPKSFLSRYPCKTEYPFEEIRKNVYRFEEVTDALKKTEAQLGAAREGENAPSLASLYEKRASLLAAAQEARDASRRLEEKDAERAAARERLSANKNTLLLLQKTREHLLAADEALAGRYLDRISSSLSRYARLLGAKAVPSTDADLALFTREGGQTHSADTASRGERALYRLALRLALAEALTEKESPFFLLDDPFLTFDDVRIGQALALLEELARESQLLYLTCSSSRAP